MLRLARTSDAVWLDLSGMSLLRLPATANDWRVGGRRRTAVVGGGERTLRGRPVRRQDSARRGKQLDRVSARRRIEW